MTFDKQKYWEERKKAQEPKPKNKENPILTELEIAILTVKKTSHKNKKGYGKGKTGRVNHFIGDYKTLKVIPKSKRTPENCNQNGVANG